MRAHVGDRRATLIARKEEALKRWPHKSGTEYEAEMSAVARALDELARTIDRADVDPVERLRTWCAAAILLPHR